MDGLCTATCTRDDAQTVSNDHPDESIGEHDVHPGSRYFSMIIFIGCVYVIPRIRTKYTPEGSWLPFSSLPSHCN